MQTELYTNYEIEPNLHKVEVATFILFKLYNVFKTKSLTGQANICQMGVTCGVAPPLD